MSVLVPPHDRFTMRVWVADVILPIVANSNTEILCKRLDACMEHYGTTAYDHSMPYEFSAQRKHVHFSSTL